MNEKTNLTIPFPRKKKALLALAVLIALFSIIIIFSVLILRQKSEMAEKNEIAQDVKKIENAGIDEKKMSKETENSSKMFVFIKDKNKENEKQLFTVPSDFYGENVAGVENEADYKNGSLYIIRKMSDSVEKELWRYGKKDRLGSVPEGKKMYSGKIFKFNVSPLGKYIAITTAAKEKLIIIDAEGNILKEYDTKELGFLNSEMFPLWFGLLDWTSDEKEFWGTLGNKPIPEAIYRISLSNLEISKFSVPFDQEWDLNTDSKRIIYSDCPFMKDSSGSASFSGSNTQVDLIVYDVIKDTHSILESANSKCFNPKWINNQVIEYDNPNGTERTSRIVE